MKKNILKNSLSKEFYNQYSLLHSRDMAGSSFRPLSKIPHCCRSKASGPCLSPNVADHPLRPAKDLRLGRLLSYQLPNPTQAHLTTYIWLYKTINVLFIQDLEKNSFLDLWGRFSRVTHPFATLFKIAFDLHVLGLSLAFILSQDQTHNFYFSFFLEFLSI